jgi:hypothetical protein
MAARLAEPNGLSMETMTAAFFGPLTLAKPGHDAHQGETQKQ